MFGLGKVARKSKKQTKEVERLERRAARYLEDVRELKGELEKWKMAAVVEGLIIAGLVWIVIELI